MMRAPLENINGMGKSKTGIYNYQSIRMSDLGNNPPNLWSPKLSAFSIADVFSLLRIFYYILVADLRSFGTIYRS